MSVFYEREGVIYRQLLLIGENVWIIRYHKPISPIRVLVEELAAMKKIPAPEGFIPIEEAEGLPLSTLNKRLEVLNSLIEDETCIVDQMRRNEVAKDIAGQYGFSVRTINQWYYSYLAGGKTGLCPKPRQIEKKPLTKDQKNCRKTLYKYHLSSYKMPLSRAYNMMLMELYMDGDGVLAKSYPTFHQFRHFYYNHMYNPINKIIGQEGLSKYQRDSRPLYGHAGNIASYIGAYQMDFTIGDIYLVSRYNRKQSIGRPYICLAIDIASRLVAGVYVGLEGGSEAVVECLRQAAMNKVEYCARYGVEIKPEDWPSKGLPSEIMTDQGREFVGGRIDEVCAVYGITITNLPPYRPEQKGLVERSLQGLQEEYKYLLKHKGVIEPNYQERGAPDYRLEAALTLEEFTKVLIYCVLNHNSVRVIDGYVRSPEMAEEAVKPIASRLWRWHEQAGLSNIIPVSDNEVNCILLPRSNGKFTRYGIMYMGLAYYNKAYNSRCVAAGIKGQEDVKIAYDPNCTDYIYLIENNEFVRFELTQAKEMFRHSSYAEVQQFLEQERKIKRETEKEGIPKKVELAANIRKIGKNAAAERGGLPSKSALDSIGENRMVEREGEEE